jgi:hypothetical protein
MARTHLGGHRRIIPRDILSLLGVGMRALYASRGEGCEEVEAPRCVLVLEEVTTS